MFEFVDAVRTARTKRRWLAAIVVATAVVLAAPGASAAAQTRIGINGGRPTEWPILSQVLASQGLTQEGWLDFASRVGENWLPGTDPVPLNYPGQLGLVSGPAALTADQSTAVGQQLLHALILDELKDGPVAVAGLSEGTLVIDRELAYLQTLSGDDAPSRDALTFYVFGDMLRGLGQVYLPGVTIPFIGQTFGPVPETKYDTVVVNEEWDGWANTPDRPWNLLAVVNAVMGAVYTVNGSNDHSQTSLDSLADAVLVSEVTNSLGGTTSTYVVPREQLPITRPLLQLGVPRWVVDEIDKLLMPLIRAGYSNMTPELGPRIDHGQLVFTPPPTPELPTTATSPEAAKQVDASPVQLAITGSTTSDPVVTEEVSTEKKASTSPAASATEPVVEPVAASTANSVAAENVSTDDESSGEPTTEPTDESVKESVKESIKDAPKVEKESPKVESEPPASAPRTRPTKVREQADPDDTPEVRTATKPTDSTGADKADKTGTPAKESSSPSAGSDSSS